MKLLTLIILFFGHFVSTIKSFYGSGAKASWQSKTKTGRVVFGRKEAQEIATKDCRFPIADCRFRDEDSAEGGQDHLRNRVLGLKNAEKRLKTA